MKPPVLYNKLKQYYHEYIVYLDDYSNGFVFDDIRTAWRYYHMWKAANMTDYEYIDNYERIFKNYLGQYC